MGAIPLRREIEYPYSDGQPMGESEIHVKDLMYLVEAFTERFRERPDVYVAGNMFLYYEKGNPKAAVAPDLFVVMGVEKRVRKSYLLWQEGGCVPCLIVELTSESTCNEDQSGKKTTYERLGVEEYFLFDPLGEYLHPRLQGYRLMDGRYRRVELGADGSLTSRTTGVTLRSEGQHLRLFDHATGEPFLRDEEVRSRARAAEARLEAVEEELARVREELARSRRAAD